LGEYGTTTGRPRRIGWLDLVMVRFAARINGLDHLAVTKLDVLGGVDPLRVCVAYEHNGEAVREFPASMRVFAACRPVYEEVAGWEDISEDSWVEVVKRGYTELPEEMRAYLDLLSRETGVPVGLVSLGPSREATLDLRGT
ncbi:MAG: adenylosuccinate synthetase, partial [Thermoplasmata archaeon]|nr:adenylosuccinate synthetase [Thermoplasmata archaeon]